MGGIWDPIYNMDCLQETFSYFQSTFLEAFNKKNFPGDSSCKLQK